MNGEPALNLTNCAAWRDALGAHYPATAPLRVDLLEPMTRTLVKDLAVAECVIDSLTAKAAELLKTSEVVRASFVELSQRRVDLHALAAPFLEDAYRDAEHLAAANAFLMALAVLNGAEYRPLLPRPATTPKPGGLFAFLRRLRASGRGSAA